jgi:hypothetical protein
VAYRKAREEFGLDYSVLPQTSLSLYHAPRTPSPGRRERILARARVFFPNLPKTFTVYTIEVYTVSKPTGSYEHVASFPPGQIAETDHPEQAVRVVRRPLQQVS